MDADKLVAEWRNMKWPVTVLLATQTNNKSILFAKSNLR